MGSRSAWRWAGCILIGLAGFIYLYTHITILPDFSQKLNITEIPSTRVPVGFIGRRLATDYTRPRRLRPGTPNANATSVAEYPSGSAEQRDRAQQSAAINA